MRVRVEMTVEVDPGAWRAVYGNRGDDLNQVRRDVKDYVMTCITDSGASDERAIVSVSEAS